MLTELEGKTVKVLGLAYAAAAVFIGLLYFFIYVV